MSFVFISDYLAFAYHDRRAMTLGTNIGKGLLLLHDTDVEVLVRQVYMGAAGLEASKRLVGT